MKRHVLILGAGFGGLELATRLSETVADAVDVNFLRGDAPAAQRHDPSREYAAEKAEFGAIRRARWFGS